MFQQENSDTVTIGDLLVTLINRARLWLIFVGLGIILSVVYGTKHQDNHEYSAYLFGPSYIDSGQLIRIMSDKDLSRLIDIYYKQYQNDLRLTEKTLKNRIQFDRNKLTISIKAKQNEQHKVNEMFTQFVSHIKKQRQYINNINNWQGSVESSLKQLQQQNKVYDDAVHQFQLNMNNLSRSRDLSSVNTQTLLNNLSNTILYYQSQIFNNDAKIQHYKSQLQTLNHNIFIYGGITRSYEPIGLTSFKLVILGVILSIILSTIFVFIHEFIRKLRKEVKQKLERHII